MKRLLTVVAVVAVIGGALALAFAHETGGPQPGASQGMMGQMGRMMGQGSMMAGGLMGPMPGMMGMPAGGDSADRPWVSLALEHRERLGLSSDQARTLESLRSEFQKEATRRSAEIRVAELELADLLRAEPVDLAKVEAKLRQIEAFRSDLRLARIKTLEKGKAILTAEQWKKLEWLGPGASADAPGGMMGGRGMEEMQRFMSSERMPQAMGAMMEMARQMGNGDPMAGMVRMMEMMTMMGQTGGMMGGPMGGMMGPPQPSK